MAYIDPYIVTPTLKKEAYRFRNKNFKFSETFRYPLVIFAIVSTVFEFQRVPVELGTELFARLGVMFVECFFF